MVPNGRRSAYYSALLSENRMLVDYIAANAAKDDLGDLPQGYASPFRGNDYRSNPFEAG
jgi:hypothetical protein